MTNQQGNQMDYWNSRAQQFASGDLGAPLIPSQQDINFMRKHLSPDGHALILGVTPQLCSAALQVSETVTAVDFAENMIEALRIDGVTYQCCDWNQFFARNTDKYDNILTDGGLTCLEFPVTWSQLAVNISTHLQTGGTFTARAFINTHTPPKDNHENPNLTRFLSSMSRVDKNWMLQVDSHGDYRGYDVRYAFPPEEEVLRTFGQLALVDKFIPTYTEGEHFVSYAWRLPDI